MDFKKSDLSVNNIQKPLESFKKQEKLSKDNSSSKKEEKITSKSPTDPKYWQSVAFRGNNQPQKQEKPADFEEAKNKMFSKIWFQTEEVKARYLKGLEEVLPFGDEAVDKYIACVAYSVGLYDKERTEHFDKLIKIVFENYPKIKDVRARDLCMLMERTTSRQCPSFEAGEQFFNALIADDNYALNDKINWLDYVSNEFWNDTDLAKEFYSEPFEDKLDSVKTYIDYASSAKDEKEAVRLREFHIGNDDMKKYIALNKAGVLSAEKFTALADKTKYYSEEKEPLFNILSKLYSKVVEEGDKDYGEFFNDLTSKKLVANPFTNKNLESILEEDSPFKREAVSSLRQIGEERKNSFFGNGKEYDEVMETLCEENFKDFVECYKEEAKKPEFSSYYFFSDNVNPKTGLFDRKIYDGVKEYEAKLNGAGRRPASWFGRRSANVIKAAVDLSTGEISPFALKFMDKYFVCAEEDDNADKTRKLFKKRHTYSPEPIYKHFHEIESKYCDILEALKDAKGVHNPINAKYMAKFLEAPAPVFIYDFSFFNDLKDENGIVSDEKFKLAFKAFTQTGDLAAAARMAEAMKELGSDEVYDAIYRAEEIFGTKQSAMRNFGGFVNHCWGDGEDKVENAIFINSIVGLTDNSINLVPDLFEAFQNEDNKNFAYKLAQESEMYGYDINALANIINKYKDENGKLDDFVKEKVEVFTESKVPISYFNSLFEACVTDKENPKTGFMEDAFNKVIKIYAASGMNSAGIEPKHLVGIINGDFSPVNLKFKEKVNLLNTFITFKKEPEKYGFDVDLIDRTIDILDKSIGNDNIFIPVSEEVKTEFTKSVLGDFGVDETGYTQFEKVLKDSIPVLENLENGLPLTYSREDFIKDLSKLCDSEEKIQILKEKTGIMPILTGDLKKPEIKGYEGIFLLDSLDKNDEFQKNLYDLAYKFMYENEVKTYNNELDLELNKIIKACPEFINIIGKSQHSTHKYSLDVHSLLVLAHSIENPDYLNLNATDKVMLKIASLFHDIAKQQDIVDNGHQEPSSLYARSIVKKFFTNEDSKDRVYELVRNHHWLAEFANSSNKEEIAKELAYKFRRPNDFEIAKIMAKSDLMAVSEEFYKDHKKALDEENIKPIQKMLDEFYSTGCAAFVDYPINEKALKNHIQTINGRDFKVINFNEIGEKENLFEYGFESGKTKKDLNFLVHMMDTHTIGASLKTTEMLTSSVNGGVLSESIISPEFNRTYGNRKYGVLLSQINANLINMAESNQGSGYEKSFGDITRFIFSSSLVQDEARTNFRNGFLKELGLEPGFVSNKDFGEFYKNNIVGKTSLKQFRENEDYKIGNYTFKGKEIADAIKRYQNSLIDVKEEHHNELVGYIPKIKGVIAKEKSIDKLPEELLDFAYENNLPVILI